MYCIVHAYETITLTHASFINRCLFSVHIPTANMSRFVCATILVFAIFGLVTISAGGDCVGPYPAEFGECEEGLSWLMNNWATVDQSYYIERGVDASGSRCSIQKFLHSENHCPDCSVCPEDVAATVSSSAAAVALPPVQSTCTAGRFPAEIGKCENRINSSLSGSSDEKASKVTMGEFLKLSDDRDRYTPYAP